MVTLELFDRVLGKKQPTWEAALRKPNLELNPPVAKLIYPHIEKYAIIIPVKRTPYFHLYHELDESGITRCIPLITLEVLLIGQITLRVDDLTKITIGIQLAGFRNDSAYCHKNWPSNL
jgi:hypothetical protein